MARQHIDHFEIDPSGLIPGPETLTNRVRIKGKLVEIRSGIGNPQPPPPGSRRPITEFSRKARYNCLKTIATIDWPKLAHGWFVTLTYPDERARVSYTMATKQRSNFIRYLEHELCEKVPILWRKELKDRQSGLFKGDYLAHWHLSIFTKQDFKCWKMNHWWRKSLRYRGVIQCHKRRLESGEHAAFYLAKYLSKKAAPILLDYPPNLSKVGRAWGITRRERVPWCVEIEIEDVPDEQFQEIMAAARLTYNHEDAFAMDNFTFLGHAAERLAQRIFELLS